MDINKFQDMQEWIPTPIMLLSWPQQKLILANQRARNLFPIVCEKNGSMSDWIRDFPGLGLAIEKFQALDIKVEHLPSKRWFHISIMPVIEKKELKGICLSTILLKSTGADTQLEKLFMPLVGSSNSMAHVHTTIEAIAKYETSVLITGETGTGKELVARAIHASSPRSNGPFVPVNCSALSSTLLESELFGHVRGGFTGAIKDRKGRFEMADQGTLFLDEIASLDMDVQVKLLRFLQERVIERVGSSHPVQVNVRIISATNRNLIELIRKEKFRQDLYYRLKVIQVELPSLRERQADIPELVDYFINRFNRLYKRDIRGMSRTALKMLEAYSWPGNVRELENAIEHAFVLTDQAIIDAKFLPSEIRIATENGYSTRTVPSSPQSEEESIQRALLAFNGNVSKAAKTLNMHRTTLWRKMRELDIAKSSAEDDLN